MAADVRITWLASANKTVFPACSESSPGGSRVAGVGVGVGGGGEGERSRAFCSASLLQISSRSCQRSTSAELFFAVLMALMMRKTMAAMMNMTVRVMAGSCRLPGYFW